MLLCVCPTHATRDLGKVYTHNLRLSFRDSLLPGSQLSYFQAAMTTPPLSFCNPGKKDNVFHNRASAILSQATTADCFRVKATKIRQLTPLESLLSDSPLLYKICLPFFHSQKPSSASRWQSGKESTCQYRRHRFNPWFRKIPHAVQQLALLHRNFWACALESRNRNYWSLLILEPVLHKRSHCNKKPMNCNKRIGPLTATREQSCSNEDPPQPKINK